MKPILKCEQCNKPLKSGYCEMTLPLTGERKRLCDNCAFSERETQRALHNDDLLRAAEYALTAMEYARNDINRYPYIGKSVTQLSSAIVRLREALNAETMEREYD